MAITKTDLEISNISYTNKDFEAVYTELMDIALKINNKMNPTESNEGDPFIVILKLLAFVADKINYNIDKNVLERFLTSATQEKSVRELTATLGYQMRYYQSATTSVVCRFNFSGNELYKEGSRSSRDNGIFIPKYTKFLDSTGEVLFTSTEDKFINPISKSSDAIPVIQGELKTLTVLDNDVIILENLDDDNRLYFPEPMVAENGIFIEGGSSNVDTEDSKWKLSSNLNTEIYGQYRYEFGYDSLRKLPYLRFPEWIRQIIGSGLSIKYIVTSGLNGNVSSKSITSITLSDEYLPHYEDADIEVSTENISVLNQFAADNGLNPETINEAYSGFKKTIGTYDTLVTCRDYANALYKALDEYSRNLVSNVQVADRRTDINYGCNVATFTVVGPQTESIISTSSGRPLISANELCLYPLTPSNDFTMSLDTMNYEGYNKTFTALYDTSAIESYLEDSKCLSHDYKRFAVGDIYAIKNKYKLEAYISTIYKVNASEQYDILLNINNALAEKFNARKVDFGYELVDNEIAEVIQNADNRIKYVSLYEPEVESFGYVVDAVSEGRYYTMKEESLKKVNGDDADWFKAIVAKNILSGKVEMLNYNDKFEFNYGETNGNIYEDVVKFTSSAGLSSYGTLEDGYTLKSNEVIELISPSYSNEGVTYPYGINYYFKKGNTNPEKPQITAITFNSDSSSVTVTFNTGTITKTGTNLKLKVGKKELVRGGDVATFIDYANSYTYVICEGSESSEVIDFPDIYKDASCIRKDSIYVLQSNDELIMQWTNSSDQSEEKVFKVGDMIKPNFDMCTTLYTKNVLKKTPLIKTLGDGTSHEFFTLGTSEEVTQVKVDSQSIKTKKLVLWVVNKEDNEIVWDENDSYILEDGEYFFFTDYAVNEVFTFGPGSLLRKVGFTGKTWKMAKVKDATVIAEGDIGTIREVFENLECNDSNYIEFTMQDIITLSAGDSFMSSSMVTDNVFSTISGGSYKLGEDAWAQLPSRPLGWKARASLDINCGPDTPQELQGYQTIALFDSDGQTRASLLANEVLKFNVLKQEVGGVNKDISYIDLELKKQPVTAYSYLFTSQNEKLSFGSSFGSNYYGVVIPDTLRVELPIPSVSGHNTFVMLFVQLGNGESLQVSASGDEPSLECYNNSSVGSIITSSGVYVYKIGSGTSLNLAFSSKNIACIISKPRVVSATKEINPLLGLSDTTDIKSFLSTNYAEQWNKFNVINFVEPTKHVEISSTYTLADPSSFYDYNNIANKWVIPMIDLDNSVIRIARGSKKA